MTQINVDVDKELWDKFKKVAGDGKASTALRSSIKKFVEDKTNEKQEAGPEPEGIEHRILRMTNGDLIQWRRDDHRYILHGRPQIWKLRPSELKEYYRRIIYADKMVDPFGFAGI